MAAGTVAVIDIAAVQDFQETNMSVNPESHPGFDPGLEELKRKNQELAERITAQQIESDEYKKVYKKTAHRLSGPDNEYLKNELKTEQQKMSFLLEKQKEMDDGTYKY
jgi:hypothetical protein